MSHQPAQAKVYDAIGWRHLPVLLISLLPRAWVLTLHRPKSTTQKDDDTSQSSPFPCYLEHESSYATVWSERRNTVTSAWSPYFLFIFLRNFLFLIYCCWLNLPPELTHQQHVFQIKSFMIYDFRINLSTDVTFSLAHKLRYFEMVSKTTQKFNGH